VRKGDESDYYIIPPTPGGKRKEALLLPALSIANRKESKKGSRASRRRKEKLLFSLVEHPRRGGTEEKRVFASPKGRESSWCEGRGKRGKEFNIFALFNEGKRDALHIYYILKKNRQRGGSRRGEGGKGGFGSKGAVYGGENELFTFISKDAIGRRGKGTVRLRLVLT